jgi:hypothetical protein
MNRKQTLTVVSVSALAGGMAQGAVLYSGLVNTTINSTSPTSTSFDLNQDGTPDFTVGFDGFNNNFNKPYIQGNPDSMPGSTSLAQLSIGGWYGLPVTPFGASINSSFLTPVPDSAPGPSRAYFNQDDDSTDNYPAIGAWGNGIAEGYIGLEMYDNSGLGETNFGWARLIYNQQVNTFTLVDYAYETIPGETIIAGQTNELGAPNIYGAPSSQTVPVGASPQLTVVALGAPAPIYQWRAAPLSGGTFTNLTNAGNVSGATSATLTINGATPANSAQYEVVVSNSLGFVTTTPVSLQVVTPKATPAPQVLFGGLTAHFNVSVSGLSATYKWQKNGVGLSDGGRISGSATANLQISNLQNTDTGNYAMVLTGSSFVVTSTVAPLTVLPVSSESTYDLAVLAAGPLAYYRFAETGNPATNNLIAFDNASALNGVYGVDVTNAFYSEAGPRPVDGFPGFPANNAAALFTLDDTNSLITVAPWNLNTATVTFTFWVNAPDQQAYNAAIIWSGTNSSTYAGVNYYSGYNPGGTGVGIPGNIDLGYTWNDQSAADVFWDSGIMPPTNDWSLVALEIAPSNTTLYVFNDQETNTWDQGTFPAVNVYPGDNTIAPFTNLVMAFSTPETIGNNPAVVGATEGFNGAIGDMAVFNYNLSQDQLTGLYNAALGVPPGLTFTVVNGTFQITWPLGTLVQSANLQGPWVAVPGATSPYTVPTGSAAHQYYRLLLY